MDREMSDKVGEAYAFPENATSSTELTNPGEIYNSDNSPYQEGSKKYQVSQSITNTKAVSSKNDDKETLPLAMKDDEGTNKNSLVKYDLAEHDSPAPCREDWGNHGEMENITESFPEHSVNTQWNENRNVNHGGGKSHTQSDMLSNSSFASDTSNQQIEQPRLVSVKPRVVRLTSDRSKNLLVSNITADKLVMFKVVSTIQHLTPTPSAGALFPNERTGITCQHATGNSGKGIYGHMIVTAVSVDPNTDVSQFNAKRCAAVLDGYVNVGSSKQTICVEFSVQRKTTTQYSVTKSKSDVGVIALVKETLRATKSKSHSAVTIPKVDDLEVNDSVKMNPGLSVESGALETETTPDDSKPNWMRLAIKSQESMKNDINPFLNKIDGIDERLTKVLEQLDAMATETDAIEHRANCLHTAIKDYEIALVPSDYNNMMALSAEVKEYLATFNRNIDRMLRQHTSIWTLLVRHAKDLDGLRHMMPGGADYPLEPLTPTAVSESGTESTDVTSAKEDDTVTSTDVTSNATGRNVNSNVLLVSEGRTGQSSAGKTTDHPASLNATSNAVKQEQNHYYTVKGCHTDSKFHKLEVNHNVMKEEANAMSSSLRKLNNQTETVLDMLGRLTSKARSNRDSLLAGITGVEEKMKKSGFNLGEIENEGDRSKATLSLLQTNLSAHLEKLDSVIKSLRKEQNLMKRKANNLSNEGQRVKKSILRLSNGVVEEHRHVLHLNSETNKKLAKFSEKQQTTERILKAMQKDMKIFFCKLKHSVGQLEKIHSGINEHRKEAVKNINVIAREPSSLIELSYATEEVKADKLRAQLTDYNPILKEVRAKNDYVIDRLPEQKDALRLFMALVDQACTKLEADIYKLIARSNDDIRELYASIEQNLADFTNGSAEISGKIDEFHKTVDKLKYDITFSGSSMNTAILTMLKNLQEGAGTGLEKTRETLEKMDNSMKQIVKDISFLVEFSSSVDGRVNDIVVKISIETPRIWSALENFIRDRHAELIREEIKMQHKQTALMEKIKAFIAVIANAKESERAKGQIITKFALKMKDFFEELTGELGNSAAQLGNHEHTLGNRMNELLRRKLGENEVILKELKKAMTNEINGKFDQVSKEQFKDVQIYLDKIKDRINKTTRGLQAAQTASDWVFYFLMMVCILLGLFLYTAVAFDSDAEFEMQEERRKVVAAPWVPRMVSRAVNFVWNWED